MSKGYWAAGERMATGSGDWREELLTVTVGRIDSPHTVTAMCRDFEEARAAGAATIGAQVRDAVAQATAAEREGLVRLEARAAELTAAVTAAGREVAEAKAAVVRAVGTGIDPTEAEDAYAAARRTYKRLSERKEPLTQAVEAARGALQRAETKVRAETKARAAAELAAEVEALAAQVADAVFAAAPDLYRLRGALEAARA